MLRWRYWSATMRRLHGTSQGGRRPDLLSQSSSEAGPGAGNGGIGDAELIGDRW